MRTIRDGISLTEIAGRSGSVLRHNEGFKNSEVESFPYLEIRLCTAGRSCRTSQRSARWRPFRQSPSATCYFTLLREVNPC